MEEDSGRRLPSEKFAYSKAFKCFQNKENLQNNVRALSNKNSFQKVRALSNKRLPNKEKQTWRLTKTLRFVMKKRHGRRLCHKTPRKSSSALYVRRLLKKLPWKSFKV
ncbi:hypothetical protein IGI04_035418 [Brassica rapa subsp. trilocularis]|uniref:Uncharacterized protein n=1 Tax=Brassica rapa subsp. trilocularis TaxID=1813537 RepID=A0ABQ7LBN5_BRACM|nr:hypothetical protein IGI04_035418 [Brassica rapa subsp. trilocularis]